MCAAVITSTVTAIDPGWEYIGITCEDYQCGLFWKYPQEYKLYIDTVGNYHVEGSGFGVCC